MTTSSPARETAGPRAARFIELVCRETRGERAGESLRLQQWQLDLLDDLFELRPDGRRRRYREALIGMPRKNGKSTLGSGLALYGLVADNEPGAEVYSCAGDREQARIVFGTARRMVELDPSLSRRLKVYRNVIEYPATGSIYRVLSSDASLQQGLNPSFVVFDELHVQPNEDLWNAMTLGSGTRTQPLVVAITTAGFDLESLCGRLYQHGKRLLAGQVEDETFFFRWWEPMADGDHTDPRLWREANPAYGTFLHADDFLNSVTRTSEYAFRRFRLNQWTLAQESWLPSGAWHRCRSDLELDPNLGCWVGIDVALKHDSTAVVVVQPQAERLVVRSRVWRPEGDRIDVAAIENHLRQLHRDLDVREFAYDPAYFERSAQALVDEGLPMVEFPQSPQRMVPACQHAYELITSGRIAHDGDPTLRDHVESAAQRESERGWTLSKGKSRRKIDACIAMVIAAWEATEADRSFLPAIY